MSDLQGTSTPLEAIPWTQLASLFHTYTQTARNRGVSRMVFDSENLLVPAWKDHLAPKAQHAIHGSVQNALSDVEKDLALSSIQARQIGTEDPDHARQQVSREVKTAYDLLKVAQASQPDKEWTTDVPASLFEAILQRLKSAVGQFREVQMWQHEMEAAIFWRELIPASAVEILDCLHNAYRVILNLLDHGRKRGSRRLKLWEHLPKEAEYEPLIKLRDGQRHGNKRQLPGRSRELRPGAPPAQASASGHRQPDAPSSMGLSPQPFRSGPSPFVAVSRNLQDTQPNSSRSQPVKNDPFDDRAFHLPPHAASQYDQNYLGHVGPYPPSFDQAFPVDPSAITWVPPAYDATYSLSPPRHVPAQHPSLAQSGTTYIQTPSVPPFVAPPPFVYPHSPKRRQQQHGSRQHQGNSHRQDRPHLAHNAGHYGPSQLGYAGQIHPDSFGFVNHPQQPLPEFHTLFDPSSMSPMNPCPEN